MANKLALLKQVRVKSEPSPSASPQPINSTSARAILLFLKQSSLEPVWTASYLTRTLGVDLNAARGIAAELEAVGYIEPIAGKKDTWRNTEAGDKVSGAKDARLTRKTADKAVSEFVDRVREVNRDDRFPLRVTKAIAFGGYTTAHDRIQDVEIGVELEPKLGPQVSAEEVVTALRFLKGKGRALKVNQMPGWMATMPGRVLFGLSEI